MASSGLHVRMALVQSISGGFTVAEQIYAAFYVGLCSSASIVQFVGLT